MRTRTTLVTFCVMVVGLAFAGSAHAALIGFEGIAPADDQTTEDGTTNTFNGFDVFVPHGHYQDLGFSPLVPRPSSGSDWLLHDDNQPVEITVSGGGIFSVTSIDASEWEKAFGDPHTLTLTGHLSGGGTTVANFTTDPFVPGDVMDVGFGFETFVVAGLPGFNNLIQLDIIGSSSILGPCEGFAVCGSLGYDNIVASVVPLPPALLLFGTGLTALGFMKWRRRKAS